jgi:hypothetical protein
MWRRIAVAALVSAVLFASRTDYLNAKRKFEAIEKYRIKPGTRVPLPAAELNAYVQEEMRDLISEGVRNPKVELHGNNIATGRADINFLKLQKGRGAAPNWLMRKLLDGEHEVAVTARIDSASGQATVNLQRVEIAGIPVEGAALDYLIQNYLLPKYPDAKINRPFALKYRMDRLEVAPGIAYVVMRK